MFQVCKLFASRSQEHSPLQLNCKSTGVAMYGTSQNAFEVLSNEDGMSSDLEITVTGEDAIEVETEVGT